MRAKRALIGGLFVCDFRLRSGHGSGGGRFGLPVCGMDGATDQPFAALKEVAARLDVEIPNAANCLEGLPGLLETKLASTKAATKVSEQATLIEAELKLIALRLENVVKEKLVSIQELTECLKQTDCDNRETLQKLVPLGLKVPDHLLPALQNLSLQSDQDTVQEAADDTLEDSPCSLTRVVTKLEPAFSKAAAGSSQAHMPSQVRSQLPRSLQQPCSSKPTSRSPPRRFQTSSNLDKYLEEISSNDTITLMNSKQLVSLKAAKPEAASGSPDEGAAAPLPKKPEQSPGFPSLKGSLPDVTFISGIQPLPKTPELTGKSAGQFKGSCPLTPKAPDFEERAMKFKESRPTTSKTPELKDYTTPVLKENVDLPW
ncbi:uncharacterized protein LOC119396344 [Rhipicephalus sanguineus]|uniref:uncharacterized protein LOC119396344 n=1 Tax=Rhipicephalus sanguineus TaxID=34632 RepID=UPI00189425EB|nr:uncharacterized protein LOC119396344 [Rhipicephalus sanguineus]